MPDLSARERAELISGALDMQTFSADAHVEIADCLSRMPVKPYVRGFLRSFQDDAAWFSHRARECLFELLGAAAEDEPLSMIGLLLIFGAIGFFWVGTPA